MHTDLPSAFLQAVETTVKLCVRADQRQQWTLLAESPLAATELVTALLAKDTQARRTDLGLATYAVMQWGIDKLKPDGQPIWTAYEWRAYQVLFHAYFQGMPFVELAEKLAISEQTVYQSRRMAVARLAEILHSELITPQEKALRILYYLGSRYASYTAAEQLILRLIAVLDKPLPMPALLQQLQQTAGQSETALQLQLQRLLATGALLAHEATAGALATVSQKSFVRHPTGSRLWDSPVREWDKTFLDNYTLALAPDFHHYLNTMRPSELAAAHGVLATFYSAAGEFWSAITHYQAAGDHQNAATLLVTHQRAFVNAGQTAQLLARLQEFTPRQVDEVGWAQIKLLAGDLALQQQDVQSAVRAYQQALGVADGEMRALAYYKRARAFLSLNLDETLLHYHMALEALTPTHPDHPLLVRIHTDHAWFYIQERPNLVKAEEMLRQLEVTVPSTNQLGRSYLANAWAGLRHRQGQDEAALHYRLQAWVLANETLDVEWAMIAGYNVGNDYVALHHYEQALVYYAQSRDSAERIGDKAMVGLIEKSVGACYFWLTDYDKTIEHYQRAYTLLTAIGRIHWLAHVCYDLAEVYAQVWDYPAMRRYVEEGRRLCYQLRNHTLLETLETLLATSAWLGELNARQLMALPQVKVTGAITNSAYQARTGCAQRQAVRDLNELCDLGILRREGQGRAVRYVVGQSG